MPEYLSPGVYVEEVDRGSKPLAGVSTRTGGFLGQTERGPRQPKFVTSFEDYQRTFGGFELHQMGERLENAYLPYAVYGFFENGGSRCYVARITGLDAEATSPEVGVATQTFSPIRVKAVGPGIWGNHIDVTIEDASLKARNPALFKLTVRYWLIKAGEDRDEVRNARQEEKRPAHVEEVYDNLSPDELSTDYYENRINGPSKLITIERIDAESPETVDATWLEGGEDGETVGTPDFVGKTLEAGENRIRTGLTGFEVIDDISVVAAPSQALGRFQGLTSRIVTHCEKMEDRFAVIAAEQSVDIGDPDAISRPDSSYGALYLPWIKILDPLTNIVKLIPPVGHLVGIYSRSDEERGVHKAPANEVVRGAHQLQYDITIDEQSNLNPRGINCIRSFPGRGVRVWGARTMSSDPSWKYVNVRRLFLFIEESIDEGTQWVVFESNDEQLWARVSQTISNFLIDVWRGGALMGTTSEEAFYVKCDRSTMTQNDIDNGKLIVEIGVAPVKPAEFVIFRISQWTGDAEAA
jgi:uncharacterized protein